MLDLTPEEVRRLRELADQIAMGTQGRPCWLTGARVTSIGILARVSDWLGDACGHLDTSPDRPGPALLNPPCVRPADHTGPHLDADGHSWDNQDRETSQ
ncbi:hypothetical protein CDO52_01810 [Nocardiopsis gilva YIM 90087]|uniref:Uncharacterized protein n=1 Tax=Nocardiopsis gilva YIM 90087 TaxID=1235441 RepID=A0A223S0Q7_9ACTN|nr:hypothetical protein [Nocardiopsis gilva]ASU81698.1 hypothetical protein CDO52_01810 [Nocardiopsis gilva YIM 90087]